MTIERKMKIVPHISKCWYFPDEIQTPREMVLYTLWLNGELPFYKVLLLTGMDIDKLNSELKKLIEEKEIASIELGDAEGCFKNGFSSSSFRVAR
ncbi:MAG TPA: hypothetical protein ENJ51_09450 [Leucothrix mucor]|uniref:Uncharacterized protein n=1 Tax=Leucothrix mucor TaxID=45248 RepID=A0A7V2T3Z4_LEUMU|nr:hypothetical protein [Leucothrix mucor]